MLVTLICLIYICCASAKNRRARRNAEIQLELQLEKAEKEGVQLPDELKKRLSTSKQKRVRKGTLSAIFSGVEEEIERKDGKKGRRGTKGEGYYDPTGKQPQEEEKSGDYSDEEIDRKRSKKNRAAKHALTRYAASEAADAANSSSSMGLMTPGGIAPLVTSVPKGKQAREERRSKKRALEDTNISPGGNEAIIENYNTNKGASGKKLIVENDCALEEMSDKDGDDLNDRVENNNTGI